VMPKRRGKTDVAQNALRVIEEAIGEPLIEAAPERRKNPAAVALGRKGGLKGGKARAESLSAKKRSEIAKKAAKTRWNSN
jgi:hypothetical protein